jgi:MbtH protein
MDFDNNEVQDYKVLINHEEQYSLWMAHLDIPLGWKEVFAGNKQECLDHVNEVWTDMRPKSLREFDAKAKL